MLCRQDGQFCPSLLSQIHDRMEGNGKQASDGPNDNCPQLFSNGRNVIIGGAWVGGHMQSKRFRRHGGRETQQGLESIADVRLTW